MPKRTDIKSILIIGAGPFTPSPRRGEGLGEGARRSGLTSNAEPPHPVGCADSTSPRRGEVNRAVAGHEQLLTDCLQDTLGVLKHIVVPEADHAIAERFHGLGARGVRFRRVLASIQFDDQVLVSAGEVSDVRADRELADEFGTFETAAAQIVPKAILGVGRLVPQLARDGRQPFFRQGRTPSSQPSPRLGEGAIRRRGTKVQGSFLVNA
jgi:hypothetical protein